MTTSFLKPFATPDDEREPTFALDVASLAVHHIDAVVFETAPFKVMPHRPMARPATFGVASHLASLDDLDN